jgi:hypothetical protein
MRISMKRPANLLIMRSVVKYPYPGTHWCPTPPEDKTNKPLCRPLPVAVKPPPPPLVRAEKPGISFVAFLLLSCLSPHISRWFRCMDVNKGGASSEYAGGIERCLGWQAKTDTRCPTNTSCSTQDQRSHLLSPPEPT